MSAAKRRWQRLTNHGPGRRLDDLDNDPVAVARYGATPRSAPPAPGAPGGAAPARPARSASGGVQ